MRYLAGAFIALLVTRGVAQDWPSHIGQRDYGNEHLSTQTCTTSDECNDDKYCGVPPDIFALVHLWEGDAGLRFFCIPVERDGQFCDPQFPDACAEGLECLVEIPPDDPKFLPEWQFYRCQVPGGSQRMSDGSMANPQDSGRAELEEAKPTTEPNMGGEGPGEGADQMRSAEPTAELRVEAEGPGEGADRMSSSGPPEVVAGISGAEWTGLTNTSDH